jgi:hypothetical protein
MLAKKFTTTRLGRVVQIASFMKDVKINSGKKYIELHSREHVNKHKRMYTFVQYVLALTVTWSGILIRQKYLIFAPKWGIYLHLKTAVQST